MEQERIQRRKEFPARCWYGSIGLIFGLFSFLWLPAYIAASSYKDRSYPWKGLEW